MGFVPPGAENQAKIDANCGFGENGDTYCATNYEGARFEVRYSKARGFWGPDAEPFEARLINGQWMTSEIVAGNRPDVLAALQAGGLSVREIAERTGLPKSTVADRLKRRDR